MKQFNFPVRITIPHMRLLHNEHHGTNACNDADSCPTLRAGVHRIYLAAPLAAQAGAKVQTSAIIGSLTSSCGSSIPGFFARTLELVH
jgi:hypothetical protein